MTDLPQASGALPEQAPPGAFEPRIIAFCCQYCAYSAADMAGSMRLQYPPNIEIVLVPCTGRFDVILALKALEGGADGVYAAGCLEGSCHFLDGNLRARRRVLRLRQELEAAGIDGMRVEMYNLSASQGPRFAEIAREFSRRISELGPGPAAAMASKAETVRPVPPAAVPAAGSPRSSQESS
ncbi:MAG: hydrogenase iron-sulfur subunit [Deltaproteobacteria bacterium]|jgi:coenzyme F420-reducing hydrogenase delta subunit|nr:hydrogenase iron-sulfur subunit [Deltaproteobacteria bacterium]